MGVSVAHSEKARLRAENLRLHSQREQMKALIGDREFVEYVIACAQLREATHPLVAPRQDGVRNKSAERPSPGAGVHPRLVSKLRYVRRERRRLTKEIHHVLDDPDASPPRRKGKICPKCGKGGRLGAEACDRLRCNGAELSS